MTNRMLKGFLRNMVVAGGVLLVACCTGGVKAANAQTNKWTSQSTLRARAAWAQHARQLQHERWMHRHHKPYIVRGRIHPWSSTQASAWEKAHNGRTWSSMHQTWHPGDTGGRPHTMRHGHNRVNENGSRDENRDNIGSGRDRSHDYAHDRNHGNN